MMPSHRSSIIPTESPLVRCVGSCRVVWSRERFAPAAPTHRSAAGPIGHPAINPKAWVDRQSGGSGPRVRLIGTFAGIDPVLSGSFRFSL
jgi:hypothetical protein